MPDRDLSPDAASTVGEGPWAGVIQRYRRFLPVTGATPVITLLEGNTPLVPAVRLARRAGLRSPVWLKLEGLNPTGSFKDRGMTLAVSKAAEEGARAVLCASTGNTSASAAAYAARAGMRSVVLIPRGKIALGKLTQAIIHAASVIQIEGSFDDALKIVKALSRDYPITLVNSLNPHRLEGQKTAAFEVCEQLGGRAPDFHYIPVGNAGNITAYWMGYREFHREGLIDSLPRMRGWQAEGAAPIVRGRVVENPETVASAIRIGNPANWEAAVSAVKESGGKIDMVSDEEILAAYRLLAATEGIFCEPASAASVAGLLKDAAAGGLPPDAEVVCTLTGHGLKDPDSVIRMTEKPPTVEATLKAVVAHLGLSREAGERQGARKTGGKAGDQKGGPEEPSP
ncbi:MAG: threonine synthase [Candidatus Tectomicrobia bacterium]|nr:threonine synthase [Candidatus Tectomicrobia bacterium]